MKKQTFFFTIFVSVALCLWTSKVFGQSFPEKPTARLGKGTVEKIAYTPDGKLLAAAGSLGIWLYDAANLTEVGLLESPTWMNSLAISPDGKTIASWSTFWDADDKVRLWDVETKQQVGLFKHPHIVASVAFSPDGKLLASTSGNTLDPIVLWEIEAQKQVGRLEHKGGIAVGFSPDGKILASWGAATDVRLWNVGTGQEIGRLQHPAEHTVWSVAFSPDGKLLRETFWAAM